VVESSAIFAELEHAPPPAFEPRPPATDARRRWFELALVLLVALTTPVAQALFLLYGGPGSAPRMDNARWIFGMVQEATSLLLLGYVLSRRHLRFRDLGLRWSLRGAGAGVLLAVVSYAAYYVGYVLVHFIHQAIFGAGIVVLNGKNFFDHPATAIIPFSILNPFFEELIVRAYLMTEVLELTGSRIKAVALSVLVQFSYHLYYGWQGAIMISFIFLVFALYFVRTRRALPVIVAHGLIDFYAILRLW
jgi:membrane protease YdiL (CAAX protease family)